MSATVHDELDEANPLLAQNVTSQKTNNEHFYERVKPTQRE